MKAPILPTLFLLAVAASAQDRKPVPPAPEPPVELPSKVAAGKVMGRVLDADRFAVPGATVVVASTERSGKAASWGTEAKTGVDGRFEVDVPLPGGARNVHVRVRHLGYVVWSGPPTRVFEDQSVDVGEIELAPADGDAEGECQLTVRVVTSTGEAPPACTLRLDHLVPREIAKAGDWGHWWNNIDVMRQEDSRTSTNQHPGGQGLGAPAANFTLTAKRLGAKALRVVPAGEDYAPCEVRLTASEGSQEVVVVLPRARKVKGRLLTLDGEVPARMRGHLRWSVDPNEWVRLDLDPQGHFEVSLAPDEYELVLDPMGYAPWSEVRKTIDAHTTDITVRIKRRDDPRDVGDHAAELHGHLIGPDGGNVAWKKPQLEVWWVEEAEGDWERDILPNFLVAPPVQRAAFWEPGDEPFEKPKPSSEVHLTGIAEGRRIVYLAVRGFAFDVAGPFEFAKGEVKRDVKFHLRRGVHVPVKVQDPAGNPIDAAAVFVTGTGPFSEGKIHETDEAYVEIDGRGSFHANRWARALGGSATIGHLPEGRELRIAAVHPDYSPGATEVFQPDSTKPRTALIITLKPR